MHLFLTHTLDTDQPVISGPEHHHLTRVLRMSTGDVVLLTSGTGTVAEAVIEHIDRTETRCRVTAVHEEFNEPRVAVTLLQGVLKNPGKMDWLVEKGTELGIAAFVPLLTERTVAKSVKTDRLQKIAETATKQTLRGRIPTVHDPQSLEHAIAAMANAHLLLFHESAPADAVPEKLTMDDRPLAVFIGPEGGFSDEEVALLRDRGAEVLSLGPRRLRGETAGVVALARVAARIG